MNVQYAVVCRLGSFDELVGIFGTEEEARAAMGENDKLFELTPLEQ